MSLLLWVRIQGPVWSFTTRSTPVEAKNPYPADGATDVFTDIVLSWTPDPRATSHDVYFGPSNPPASIGNQIRSDYNPGTLEPGTYWWHIDTVVQMDEISMVYPGDLWSFTTVEDIEVSPYIYIQEQLKCGSCDCILYDLGYAMHISVAYGVLYTNVPVCKVHSSEGATVDLRLHYDSGKADGSVAERQTVLGYGWTHNYNIHLIVLAQDVFMPDSTGRMTRFRQQPDGSYTPSDGQTHTLSRIDSNTFLLEEVDGTKRTFKLFDPAPWSADGSLYELTRIKDVQGRVTALSYNPQGLLQTITDPYGRQVALAYNGRGLIENITNADGTVTKIEYTDDNLSRIMDPLGYTLKYTYDAENRMTTEKLKDDTTWTCVYNDDGKPYQLIDGDGQVYGTVTNPLNWAIDNDRLQQSGELRYVPGQTTVTDGEGNITYYDYDRNGYITQIYAPNHPGTINEFDDELRHVGRTDEEANQWQYEYDAYGNRTRVTDPIGNETEMFYEHANIHSLLTKNIEPDGDEWIYEHDSSGNLIREIDPIVEQPDDKVITHTYNSQGLRSSTTDRNGNITQWQYNGDGTLARRTVDPNGLEIVSEYEYDTLGRTTQQTVYRDQNLADPVVTTYDYDAMGRLIKQVLDPNGLNLTTQYEYDGAGRKKNVTNPRAVTTSYEYDVRGRLMTETIDPNGLNVTTRYEYDNADNQTKLIDPKGNETRYEYDDLNRLVKAIDAEDYWTLYEYDERGNQIRSSRSISPGGSPHFVTEHRYDELARRTHEIIDPCGLDLTTEFGYALSGNIGCACGTPGSSLVHKKTDPAGKVTYYHYDQLDRITSEVRKVGDANDNGGDADDAITEYEYDYMGNRTSVTVKNRPKDDLVTAFTYDAAGRIREQVAGPGGSNLTTTYIYDGAGNVIGQATPQGNLIISMYDKADRLISQSDSIGTVAGYTYDENGNVLTETDGLGHTFRYTYDNADRLITLYDPQVESPTDKHTSYEYDENGNLIRDKDNESLVTEYTYDGLDRRIETSRDPCGLDITITRTYDGVGSLVQITDDNGNATAYEYDAANRKIREVYADGTDVLFGYDAAGNMTSRTDQMDNATGYSYDDLHRLTARTYADGRAGTFTYDRAGRMLTADNDHSHIERSYDDTSRITGSTQSDLPQTYSHTVGYAYSTTPNTRTLTYPGGKEVVEVYDVRNRLTEVWQDGVKTVWYTYDDSSNRILTKNFANGTKAEYAYNDNDWVVGLRHIGPDGRTFAGFAHDYDAVGNRLNAINMQNVLPYDDAKPVTQSEMYSYDAMYRLVDFKRGMSLGGDIPWPTRDRTWQLDGVHNWTQFDIDNNSYTNSVNQMNEYDDPSTDGVGSIPDDDGLSDDFMVDQSASGRNFAHDKNGNLVDDDVNMYEYDYENRLIRATRKPDNVILGEYHYDALGRRIKKQAGGVSIVYVYTYNWRAIEEYKGSVLARSYAYGQWIDEVLTMDRTVEGDRLYYYANALGSAIALTDSTGLPVEGYSYDAYGQPLFFVPVAESTIGNPYLFTGRRYDPETGWYYYRTRYLDPAAGRFTTRDTIGMWGDELNLGNGYAYLGSNPMSGKDPLGLKACETLTGFGHGDEKDISQQLPCNASSFDEQSKENIEDAMWASLIKKANNFCKRNGECPNNCECVAGDTDVSGKWTYKEDKNKCTATYTANIKAKKCVCVDKK